MQKMSLSSSLGATLFESTNEPFKRYGESGSPDELDQAIRYAQQAVDSTPSNDPKRTKYLADLGTGYYTRFVTYRKEPSDVESAISALDQSVKLTPADDPEHAHRLVQPGDALLLRFNDKSLDTNPHDVERAVKLHELALKATAPDDQLHAITLVALGDTLTTRFGADENGYRHQRSRSRDQMERRRIESRQ